MATCATRRRRCDAPFGRVDAAEFQARYRALLGERATPRANLACVECERCEGCRDCTFCRGCRQLIRCHFCVDCSDCIDSSHCRQSKVLRSCQHCVGSEQCVDSAYLVQSVGLSGCSYCFGCVSLSSKDFHILNEPYERSEYFRLTQQLSRALRLR